MYAFKKHLISYAVVIGLFWIVFLVFRSGVFSLYQGNYTVPWPVVPMVIWGVFVAIHYLRTTK